MKSFLPTTRTLLQRGGGGAGAAAGGSPLAPLDADAVIKVVFESARRSGVDLPPQSGGGSGLGAFGSGSGGVVVASDAAKRQAREYALRVQKFREHQRRAAPAAGSMPSATVHFSLAEGEQQSADDDPLATLFSSIESPRVKQMTRPIPSPAQPVPSLFQHRDKSKQEPQKEGAATTTTTTAGEAASAATTMPPVRQADRGKSKAKRPPSPTRKASPLRKPPSVASKAAAMAAQANLQLHVPSPAQRKPSPQRLKDEAAATTTMLHKEVPSEATAARDQERDQQAALRRRSSAAGIAEALAAEQQQKQQKDEQPKTTTATTAFEPAARPSMQTTLSPAAEQEMEAARRARAAAAVVAGDTTATAATATTTTARISKIEERKLDEKAASSSSSLAVDFTKSTTATSTPEADGGTATNVVEQWTTIRATELEDLRAEREAAAAAELAERAAKVERAKVDAWIKSRTEGAQAPDPLGRLSGKLPAIREMHDLFTAPTWDRAFAAFAAVQRDPATNAETLAHALCLAAAHTWRWPTHRKQEILPKFEAIMSAKGSSSSPSSSSSPTAATAGNNSNVINLARALPPATRNMLHMTIQSDAQAAERFAALADTERATLPRFLFERYASRHIETLMVGGSWEAALGFVARMKTLRQDPFLRNESILLRVIASPRAMSQMMQNVALFATTAVGQGSSSLASSHPVQRKRDHKQVLANIVHGIEQQCRSKLSLLGRSHAAQLMHAYGRLRMFSDVRRIYSEMRERGELDEEIAAAHLRTSVTSAIEASIPELRKLGVNVLSSPCTRAIVYSMLSRDEAAPAIETLRAYATVTPPTEWSIADIRAAVSAVDAVALKERAADPSSRAAATAAAAASLPAGQIPPPLHTAANPPDPAMVDTIRSAALAAYQRTDFACPRVVSFLIVALTALGRTQHVLEVARTMCSTATNLNNNRVLDMMSENAFRLLNEALASANQPIRQASPQRIAFREQSQKRREERVAASTRSAVAQQEQQQPPFGGSGGASPVAAAFDAQAKQISEQQQKLKQQQQEAMQRAQQQQQASSIPAAVSERMLEFGRTRTWVDALTVLQSVEVVRRAQAGTEAVPQPLTAAVTLLFNCAISAAVDRVDIVDQIASEMRRLGLPANATTNNTIMTAFGKTDTRWDEALQLFASPGTAKDASTYSVALSVLGKRAQWEKAAQVFAEMKKQPGMTKPSAVAYGLLVQSAHRDNWLLTLRAYQEMVKVHGSSSAREVVVNRVIKALDSAGKTAESTRLLESLRKPKK